MMTKCLYEPDEDAQFPHLFVAPAGSFTTDVLFNAPLRWPLIFVISAVSSRGLPLNRGAEGTGVFMCAPGTRNSNDTSTARIPSASPVTNNSCLDDFETSNASAAIFAGGLAVLFGRYGIGNYSGCTLKHLADYFYVTALTASRPQSESTLWHVNNASVYFSRRMGFGRLNLGKALELASRWESVGEFMTVSTTLERTNVILPLPKDGDPPSGDTYLDFKRVDTPTNNPKIANSSVIEVQLKLKMRDPQFGSLSVVLISPAGTISELKISTESDVNSNVEELELTSYEFLGEAGNGTWTLLIPSIDSANRGIVIDANLTIYYTAAPPLLKSLQTPAEDPYSDAGLNTTIFKFLNDSVIMEAGKPFKTDVELPESSIMCPYLSYLQHETNRLKIKTKMINNNKTITLDTVPTVYANGTKLSLVVESLYNNSNCGFVASTIINYTNNNTEPGIIQPNINTIIPVGSKDLDISYALNMIKSIDDGYSTSACVSIIASSSNVVLKRTFVRNTGQLFFDDSIPSNIEFKLEITPSSYRNRADFQPISISLLQRAADGKLLVVKNKSVINFSVPSFISIIPISISLVISSLSFILFIFKSDKLLNSPLSVFPFPFKSLHTFSSENAASLV